MNEGNGYFTSFLVRESDANWWSAPEIMQYHVSFTSSGYGDELFQLLDIDLPRQLDCAVRDRKAQFLAGRYCAAHVLKRLGSPASVGICNDRSPAWPKGITGSISHTGDQAVAAATRNSNVLGVGVDIEDQITPDTAQEIQHHILNDSEWHWLELPDMKPTEALTLIFSVKESFFKALYPSVNAFFGFDTISVSAIDTRIRKVDFVLNTQLAGGQWAAGRGFVAEYQRLASGALASLVIVRAL